MEVAAITGTAAVGKDCRLLLRDMGERAIDALVIDMIFRATFEKEVVM